MKKLEKHIYRAKLIKIYDGDTLSADIDLGFNVWITAKIRMFGLDTWESRTRNKAEKEKGLKAKARTTELLNEISKNPGYFRLRSFGKGKFGRVLGEIFILDKKGSQINVNETLIKEGHAYIYHGEKKRTFKV